MKYGIAISLLLILVGIIGCGDGPDSCVLSGSVIYNGQPVETGAITFFPEDGKGPTAGANIVAGKYRVENLTPGRKKALVAGTLQKSNVPTGERTVEQMMALSKQESPKNPAALRIPPDAEGNQEIVEITSGEQTHDFNLTTSEQSN